MRELKGEYFCGNIANFSGKNNHQVSKKEKETLFFCHILDSHLISVPGLVDLNIAEEFEATTSGGASSDMQWSKRKSRSWRK
jgi:hypothetical protein